MIWIIRQAGRGGARSGGKPQPEKQAGPGGAVLFLVILAVVCIKVPAVLCGVIPLAILGAVIVMANWPRKTGPKPDPLDEVLARWRDEDGGAR